MTLEQLQRPNVRFENLDIKIAAALFKILHGTFLRHVQKYEHAAAEDGGADDGDRVVELEPDALQHTEENHRSQGDPGTDRQGYSNSASWPPFPRAPGQR